MQKDFHYYGVFNLSLGAGIEPVTAYKIAYSSQYVMILQNQKRR